MNLLNTSSDGFGVYIHAATGTRSALHIRDYSVGTDLFSIKGNGNMSVTGNSTFAGRISSSYSDASIMGSLQNTHATGYGLKLMATPGNVTNRSIPISLKSIHDGTALVVRICILEDHKS